MMPFATALKRTGGVKLLADGLTATVGETGPYAVLTCYTLGDFVRIGAPFALIVIIVSVLLVPWLLPL
jgi:di/tricarboxylate transporter